MSTRFVRGEARTESPRLKEVPRLKAAGERTDGRGPDGRFMPGNRAGVAQGEKAIIRKSLGELGHLAKDTLRLFRAILRALPSDGPGVRQLVAAQARHATMATHYANEAAKAGLATPEGLRLAEASRSHDGTAQRLAVSAYDRAVREANAKPAALPWFGGES